MTVYHPFRVEYLEEPEIQFGDGRSESSPKRGLFKYGPRLREDEHHAIRVGIIGDRTSIQRLSGLFQDMRSPIHTNPDDDDVKPWQVPYPGTGEQSNLNISIDDTKAWQQRISKASLRAIRTESSTKAKMEELLNQLQGDIEFLADIDGPDVIVVCIPKKVIDECTPDTESESKIQAAGSDLRNRIKILGMEAGIPTQLVKPSTLDINSERQRASRAWNLTAGLLYKSQRGYPWKTKDLDAGTCYAGISFYHKRGRGDSAVRAALTHVFTHHGHTILQSNPMRNMEEDDNGKPHLSYEGAQQLVKRIIDHYKQGKGGSPPSRLVLHKTSAFWEEEREGFLDAASDVATRDLVHVRERTDVRLFTDGQFTPQRGRLFSIPDDDRHYLFTTGYAASVGTYEGSNIPSPIEVRPDEFCETPSRQLCEETLFLTKMDWNTTALAVKMPVTIKIARKVGRVLSDVDANPDDAQVQYFYYM
ncbi:hypothetical protein SAMN05216388_101852 [Halorientalis persicus]|uniref:Piwi domain-containing protein n=1 Tax=Halorientalis persicus TaxID=1367881 RepID=A0A1H8S982_9EURY|nr:hypothetical protein [Halorientalis persicus]SEO75609.1 hypothetical protein SAMN05216388_101852 [Halorientalis persicus]